MTSYAIIDSAGSVQSVGRCESKLINIVPVPKGFHLVEIDHGVFNIVARTHPHYYKHDGISSVLLKKKPLTLHVDKFVFVANFPHPAPPAGAAVVWDSAAITWEAPEPVMMWCNGPAGAHKNGLNAVASTPANIKVQVDPADPNYYTERNARPWSALGSGDPGGAIILNAEAPSNG